MIRSIAQSYAIELLQDIKGIEKPKTKSSFSYFGWDFWGFTSDASAGRILEEMMAEPELLHFGRWSPTTGGASGATNLLTQKWRFNPTPADDNIFAPPTSADRDIMGFKIGNHTINTLRYVIYRTTIWDIFQEMTLRHPNFIASPVPYSEPGSERMTMFLGLPK